MSGKKGVPYSSDEIVEFLRADGVTSDDLKEMALKAAERISKNWGDEHDPVFWKNAFGYHK